MAVNPEVLLQRPPQITHAHYGPRDAILYALAVGAGNPDPGDPLDLAFLYERSLSVLPTMAIVLAAPPFWLDDPALGMDWRRALNAGQELELHAPLAIEAKVWTELSID